MSRWFWTENRFAWPMVAAIVYLCASLIAVDFAWRVIEMPFDTFLLTAAAIDLAAAAILIGIYRVYWRKAE
jgi:hypothetical protein